MKSIITAVVVGLFLFVASAGMSWWLIYTPPEVADPDAVAEAPASEFPVDVAQDEKQEIMPVSLRPETPMSLEAITGLAETIMKKEKKVFDAQQALKKEEQRIGLLFDDLKREQEELSGFASRIEGMIMEAKQAVKLLQIEKDDIEKKSAELTKLEKKSGIKGDEIEDAKLANQIKNLVNVLEEMDGTDAANVLKQFADRGKIHVAAKALSQLDERQKGKVLKGLGSDPTLIADLLDSAIKSQADTIRR